jgi:hypothetical protein
MTTVYEPLSEAAAQLRARPRAASMTAAGDQDAAEWRDAFAQFGLDLSDPAVAAGAFAVAQILLYRLADAQDIDGETALASIGSFIADATVATAAYVE